MTIDNLKLWNSVQETNPANTKPVSFGRKFTAIDAYSQIKKATEVFGPYGTWGLKDIRHTFIEGTTMVMAVADFCYNGAGILTEGESKISFPVSSSILYISEKGKVDDEFAKKLETDMITKALSRLGFNSDVFMGLFDDNRYVAAMNEKFKQISPEPVDQEKVNKAFDFIVAQIDNEEQDDTVTADRVKRGYNKLTQDEAVLLNEKLKAIKHGKKQYNTILRDYLSYKEPEPEPPAHMLGD